MAPGQWRETSDAAWRPPTPRRAAAEELSGYSELVEVGRGGDSVVYRARQESMHRDVAIKVLDVDDPSRAARFAREIEITVQLGRQHPNIVTVLDVGTTSSGRPAIVMDFFEGGTLHDRLRALGPLPVEEVGRIGAVLADALSFAHARGVLHRDVKPQNVLVLPTSWVLTDFGIARLIGSEHTSSAETFTYRHAAPQILDGQPPTAADDIWSLGSTLYTLLDGRPPFASGDPEDDSALAYLRRARTEPPRPLAVAGAERIASVIARCLSKDTAGRWASAAELRDALLALRTSAWEPGGASAVPLAITDGPSSLPGAGSFPATPPIGTPTSAPPPVAGLPAIVSSVSVAPPQHRAEPAEPVGALPAAGVGVGVASVGDALPPDGVDGSDDHDDLDGEEPRRRSRLPIVLGVVALVIGLVLGIAGAVLRGDDAQDPPAAAPSSAVSTSPAGSASPSDPPTSAPVATGTPAPDPKLSPTFEELRYEDGFLIMRWTDPSNGEGQFNLVEIVDKDTKIPRGIFPAGELSAELKLPLAPGEACFSMAVVIPFGPFGVSDPRCTTVPS